jgi:serine protease AprX
LFHRSYPQDHTDTGLLPLAARMGAPTAFTGRGVCMAFIDSGFYPHPDIADRIRLYVDASTRRITEGRLMPSANPVNWHGQMTSVVAAGSGLTSGGRYRGLACEAQLVLIRVSTPKGAVKEADILRGLQWLIKNAARHNIRVASISLGGDHASSDPSHPLHSAVRTLTAQGVTVMVAAGNDALGALLPPASAGTAITVGGYDDGNSLDTARWRPFPTSHGISDDGALKPDITAPAAWIASPILPGTVMAREAPWLVPMLALKQEERYAFMLLLRTGLPDLTFIESLRHVSEDALRKQVQARIQEHKLVDEHLQHVDGTSVSTAIAASVAALLLEANPRLAPDDIKQVLKATASALPDTAPERQSAGVINVAAALAAVT